MLKVDKDPTIIHGNNSFTVKIGYIEISVCLRTRPVKYVNSSQTSPLSITVRQMGIPASITTYHVTHIIRTEQLPIGPLLINVIEIQIQIRIFKF